MHLPTLRYQSKNSTMKLTLKTLKNDKFQIDIDDAATVKDAKAMIANEKSLQLKTMKLIHAGKILADSDALSSIGIKENEFLVVLAKPEPAAAPATPAPAEAAPSDGAAATSTPTPAAAEETAAQSSSDSAPSVGTQAQIDQIVGMGFTAQQATDALRAAFGNSARAVEYLMNPDSMPTSMETDAPAPTEAAPTPAAETTQAPAASDGDGPGELSASSPLYPLLTNPSFMQLRGLVQREPQILPTLLQELVRAQPELIRLLNDNREDFYRLLNTPVDMGGAGGGGGRPGVQQIRVTPEEDEAINRLVMITGQSKGAVAEAYFACDKNEELAANYLLENSGFD